ncbi:PEST proteolytic signal-containing nuclear protein [Nilaparvata lugens]|uniref:PEST proteolytic signal-containing nuclear protein n=1 Tax=Nilaparvata lugens TaxID=108931 RepID=UPI000B980D11|nr:PEST proteolytic signal-containing nuclear protein [Nilaparvata lugens]
MHKRKYQESDRKGSESRRHDREEKDRKEYKNKDDDSDGETKKQKMKFSIGAMRKPLGAGMAITSKPTVKAINIKLEPQRSQVVRVKSTLQSVFNSDSEEEEEMPPEAKMRMRNIGRETPTSAGPNSFGKTKQGFCNAQKVFEKNLKKAALDAGDGEK